MGIKNPFQFVAGWIMIGIGIATANPKLFAMGGLMVMGSFVGLSERHIQQTSNPLSPNEHIPVVYGSVSGVGLRMVDRRIDTDSEDDRVLYLVGAACMGSRDGAPDDAAISAINSIYFGHVEAVDASDNVQHPFIKNASSGTQSVGSVPGVTTVNTVRYLARYLGTTTQTVDPALNSAFPSEYPTTSRARGLAYLALALQFERSVYNLGQPPRITADIDGRVVWDPRLGASSSGANWAHSDNPALCLLDYLLDDVVGPGLAESDLDIDSFKTIANYCDTSVAAPIIGDTNRTTARFRCNGILDTSRPIQQNIAELLTSMGTTSELVYQGGVYRLVVRRNVGTSGFGTIALDHSNIQGEPEFNVRLPGIDSRFNRVTCQFVEGSLQPPRVLTETWPPTGSNTHLTDDNDVLSELTVELPFCAHGYSYHQARDTARIALRESREGITSSVVVDESGLTLEVGDVVLVTHDTPGWSAKAFWVRGVFIDCPTEEGDENHVRLILQEYQSTVYDYSSADAEPDWPDTSHVDEKDIAAPTNLAATSDYLDEGDGTVINRINVTWTKAASLFLKHTEIQAKKSTASTWTTVDLVAEDDDQETTFDAHTFGVKGDDVDVRARSVTLRDFTSDWASTVTVTIGGKTAGPGAVTGLAGTFKDGNLVLDWNDGGEADLSYWQIREGGASFDAGTVVKSRVDTNHYVIPRDSLTKRSYTIRVAAVNRSGVVGVADTVTLTDAVPNPSAITSPPVTTAGRDIIGVKIDNYGATGATEFLLYADTVSGFTPGPTNLRKAGASPWVIFGASDPDMRFISFDTSGLGWEDGTVVYMKIGLKDALTDVLGEAIQYTAEFSETVNGVPNNALTAGAPQNAPSSGTFASSVEGNLSRYVTLSWAYTQGDPGAHFFRIYRKEGSTAPTGASNEEFAEVSASARSFKFESLVSSVALSYGITAVRVVGDTEYETAIHAPAAWTNLAQVTLNIGGVVSVPPSGGAEVDGDFHVDNASTGAIKYGTASAAGESGRGITFSFTDFAARGDTVDYSTGGYIQNGGAAGETIAVWAAAILPPNTTLTDISLRLYRGTTNDSVSYQIYEVTSAPSATLLDSGSHGGTGWGTFTKFYSKTIQEAYQIVMFVNLTNESSFQNRTRISWIEAGYDRVNMEHAY